VGLSQAEDKHFRERVGSLALFVLMRISASGEATMPYRSLQNTAAAGVPRGNAAGGVTASSRSGDDNGGAKQYT
jgi:hypothetical protein